MSRTKNRGRVLVLAFLVVLTLAVVNWVSSAPVSRGVAAQRTTEDEPELEEFVPSEKVPADTAVAFPVDI